jgi:hypothetical protein
VVKESAEEITSREAESTLKGGGKHHNLIRIGCWDVFPGGKTPLQHGAVWEKVICNKFENLAFIHDGWLKQVWVRGGHGWEEVSLGHEIVTCAGEVFAWK